MQGSMNAAASSCMAGTRPAAVVPVVFADSAGISSASAPTLCVKKPGNRSMFRANATDKAIENSLPALRCCPAKHIAPQINMNKIIAAVQSCMAELSLNLKSFRGF